MLLLAGCRSIYSSYIAGWGDHFPPSFVSENSTQTSTNCHCSLVAPSKLRLSMYTYILLLPAAIDYSSSSTTTYVLLPSVYIIYHNLTSLIILADRFRTGQSRKRFIWGSSKINHRRCFAAISYGDFLEDLALPWWWGVQMLLLNEGNVGTVQCTSTIMEFMEEF